MMRDKIPDEINNPKNEMLRNILEIKTEEERIQCCVTIVTQIALIVGREQNLKSIGFLEFCKQNYFLDNISASVFMKDLADKLMKEKKQIQEKGR